MVVGGESERKLDYKLEIFNFAQGINFPLQSFFHLIRVFQKGLYLLTCTLSLFMISVKGA